MHRQPPDDNSTVTSEFILLLDNVEMSSELRRRAALQLQHPVVPFFGAASTLASTLSGGLHLPPNVDLLNLDIWNVQTSSIDILVRLQHMFEGDEHPTLSKPGKNLFACVRVRAHGCNSNDFCCCAHLIVSVNVTEVVDSIIIGNSPTAAASAPRPRSLSGVFAAKEDGEAGGCHQNGAVVTMDPLAICTFIVQVSKDAL